MNPISWDVFGYYLYLPQTFIYHDPGIHDPVPVQQIIEQYHASGTFYQAHLSTQGTYIIQYTMGMAVLYAPFFLAGHLIALAGNFPADGFSLPYQYAFLAGHLFFIAAAVFLTRKLLRLYFSEWVTVITLLLLFFGTNYYVTATVSIGMPHLFMYVLFTVLLLFTHQWYKHHQKKYAVGIGLVLGLMTLCRPTEILAGLIPLLYGVTGLKQAGARVRWLYTHHRAQVGLLFLVMFLVGLPQFIFWKVYAGHFFYDSYRNAGEGFDFLSPHTGNFLFSFRKGWFVYTPMMVFACLGIFILARRRNVWGVAGLVFLVINIYVLSAWSCWWYAGSFSQRAVVDSYPLLAIGLAGCIALCLEKKIMKWIMLMPALFFVGLNLFQTWQLNQGIIDVYRMTPAYYAAVFGKTRIPEGAEQLLLIDRTKSGYDQFTDSTGYTGENIWHEEKEMCSGSNHFSAFREVPFNRLTQTDHAWLVITCEVMISGPVNRVKPSLIRTMLNARRKDYSFSGIDLEITNPQMRPGEWVTIRNTYLTPEVRSIYDHFRFFLWVRGEGRVCVRNLTLRSYSRNE